MVFNHITQVLQFIDNITIYRFRYICSPNLEGWSLSQSIEHRIFLGFWRYWGGFGRVLIFWRWQGWGPNSLVQTSKLLLRWTWRGEISALSLLSSFRGWLLWWTWLAWWTFWTSDGPKVPPLKSRKHLPAGEAVIISNFDNSRPLGNCVGEFNHNHWMQSDLLCIDGNYWRHTMGDIGAVANVIWLNPYWTISLPWSGWWLIYAMMKRYSPHIYKVTKLMKLSYYWYICFANFFGKENVQF